MIAKTPVPRYYLHFRDDMDVPDHEGEDLPDVETARSYTIDLARFQVAEMVKREGRIVLRHRIEIEDEATALRIPIGFAT